MKRQKPGLSRAEHQVIGKELQRVEQSIQTAMMEAVNAFGPGNKRVQRIEGRARTAIKALWTIRSELEELLATYHADWQVDDYYGEPPKENLSTLLADFRAIPEAQTAPTTDLLDPANFIELEHEKLAYLAGLEPKYKRAMAALRFIDAHNPIKHDWDAYLAAVAQWGMGIEAQPPDPLEYGLAPFTHNALETE